MRRQKRERALDRLQLAFRICQQSKIETAVIGELGGSFELLQSRFSEKATRHPREPGST